jgi:hypothetical protein
MPSGGASTPSVLGGNQHYAIFWSAADPISDFQDAQEMPVLNLKRSFAASDGGFSNLA